MAAANKRHCCGRQNVGCFGSESTPAAPETRTPATLLDTAAKVVAGNVPFQRVELSFPRIPEHVLNRIVYWSFPRKERYIRMYSSFVAGGSAGKEEGSENFGVPFDRGVRLLESGAVDDVLQIGEYLLPPKS